MTKSVKKTRKKHLIDILFVSALSLPLLMFPKLFLFGEVKKNNAEARNMRSLPKASIASVTKGTYQKNLEKWLTDQFVYSEPLKVWYQKINNQEYRALTAFVQPDYWRLSKSNVYTWKGSIELFNRPSERTWKKEDLTRMDELFAGINLDKKFLFYPERLIEYDLSQPDKHDGCDALLAAMNSVKVACQLNNGYSDVINNYYVTDHHWNHNGQKLGYESILKLLLPEEEPRPVQQRVETGYKFRGSMARDAAANEYADELIIDIYELPKHEIYTRVNGELKTFRKSTQNLEKVIDKTYKADSFTNFYGELYPGEYEQIIITYNQPDRQNLLIIGDSFDNAISQRLASHFNTTYIIDLRKLNTFYINDFIEENDINKLIFLGSYPTIHADDTIFRLKVTN